MEVSDTHRMMKLVDLALDLPLYTFEMQVNAPRPSGKFAAVRLAEEFNPGRDKNEVVEVNGEFINRTVGVRTLTFEILFTEGIPMSSKFISSFMRPDVQDFMVANDLAVLRHKRLENKSTTLETNWEIRECVYVECLVRRVFESPIQIIEVVEATGHFNEGDDEIVFTVHVEPKDP